MKRTIDTYEGPATITQNGRHTKVRLVYRVQEEVISLNPGVLPDEADDTIGGLRSWNGYFGPDGRSFDPGSAQVELPDGRTARIVITGIEAIDITAMGYPWIETALGDDATFQGNGPAP
jgi:hypothetical protein